MIFTLTFPIYVGQNSLMLPFKCPGVLLGILGGSVRPGSPNPDPVSDQKIVIFHIRFQTWGGHKTQQHKREIVSSLLRLNRNKKSS